MKILKFYADWCGPCKVVSQNLKNANFPIAIEEIKADENEDLVAEYGIRNIPATVLLTDNGNEIRRWVGVFDINELKKMIEQ